MPHRFAFTLMFAAALVALHPLPSAAQPADSTAGHHASIMDLLSRLRHEVRTRDSLAVVADSATGTVRELYEETIWQAHVAIQEGALALAERIKDEADHGRDMTSVRDTVNQAVRSAWPGFLSQLERRQRMLEALGRASDAATGPQRVEIESEMTQVGDRIVTGYESLVDLVLALERVGIDVAGQRAYLTAGLPRITDGLVTRIQVISRDRAGAVERLSGDPSNAELRYVYEATQERLDRVSRALSTAIRLMNRLGLDTTKYRVAQISTTGRLTTDVFSWRVLGGLLSVWWERMLGTLAVRVPQWIFQGLIVVLTFLAFRALARLVERGVREGVQRTRFSELKRRTVIRLASMGVMAIGVLVILTQLGVQVAPLLAGLGIVGFVLGFALQNTLSNFAAGGMILGNEPFDVGDEIETAGVSGTVKRMTLVCTTILTPDNQTLIIPNSTVWGGVIRNRTQQPTRRVDLTFSSGYRDDVEKVERVLREIVSEQPQVLDQPAPLIRLDRLRESSVDFVVRVWTAKERHDEVASSITRTVKLRFDREGITIPFPQRDVHLDVGGRESIEAVAGVEAAPRAE